MSTHNLCFRAKIRKDIYPCTPYIKVGCKGVYISRTCLHDGQPLSRYLFRCVTLGQEFQRMMSLNHQSPELQSFLK